MSMPASRRERRAGGAFVVAFGATVASVLSVGCEGEPIAADDPAADTLQVSPEVAEILRDLVVSPTRPQDPTNRYFEDTGAAHFGQFLFFEDSFSSSGATSCSTCHQPAKLFTDGLAVAEAEGTGTRNTPSVLNAAHYPWLNWDGSADTLWMQAMRPFESEHELDSSRATVAKRIGTDAELRRGYEAVFGTLPERETFEALPDRAMPGTEAWDRLSPEERSLIDSVFVNVSKAIAAYQRRLVSIDAPFDRFARAATTGGLVDWARVGNPGFGADELEGLRLFATELDCIACHAGPFFSDFAFHSVRVPPRDGGAPTDAGRFAGVQTLLSSPMNAAGMHSDGVESAKARRLAFLQNPSSNWGRFRTPSLRNVDLTGPYMHAGQFDSLERVLKHYSTFENALPADHHDAQEQLLRPLNLSAEEKAAVLAFLRSLSDPEIDPRLLSKPASAVENPKAKTGL